MTPADIMGEIYEMRLVRGWSGRELSDRAGVSSSTLSRAERGLGEPSISAVIRWLDALGYDLELRERRR